jgi:hypothetical protein
LVSRNQHKTSHGGDDDIDIDEELYSFAGSASMMVGSEIVPEESSVPVVASGQEPASGAAQNGYQQGITCSIGLGA